MSELFENPYSCAEEWVKGNLHAHTTFSDGSRSVEGVLEDYESRGYGFLAITDHDVFVNPADYVHKTSLVLIPGVEVSARGPHILHLDAKARIEPQGDRHAVVRNIRAQRSFAVLNHPNWGRDFNHFPHELMEALDGYIGIEIYNGVIERLPGTALATDRWDRLLSTGRKVWGFANDDSHHPCDMEIAWNVVRVTEKTPESVIRALKAGNFYVSTGVEISDIALKDGVIRVETTNASRIRFLSCDGVIEQTTEGSVAEFILPKTDGDAKRLGYIRAECYGSGGRIAWTQPLFYRPKA